MLTRIQIDDSVQVMESSSPRWQGLQIDDIVEAMEVETPSPRAHGRHGKRRPKP